jgi:hypothetical protein
MNLKSALYALLYLRPCRAYALDFVEDKYADPVKGCLYSLQLWRLHRFWFNFAHRHRFSEKV